MLVGTRAGKCRTATALGRVFRRGLLDDLNERNKKEYERRSAAFIRHERQMFREEMFERACRRFEANRFRVSDLTMNAGEWGDPMEMKAAFREIDSDGDGFVSAAELGDYLSAWGAFLDKQDLDKMIRFADKDGDGKVSFYEFARMLRGEYDPPLGRIRRANASATAPAQYNPEDSEADSRWAGI